MNTYPDKQPVTDTPVTSGEPSDKVALSETHLIPAGGGEGEHDSAPLAATRAHVESEREDAANALDTDPGFELVRLAVSTLRARDRRTTAAAVKTEMQRLSAGGFSELERGYESFRQFLLAAESAGVVSVQLPQYGSGQDALVGPPGDLVPPTPRVNSPRRIRADIWAAFFDYRPGMVHVFDRREHRAEIFPEKPAPMEPSSVTELRARFQSYPSEFYLVEPVQYDEQIGWMREFIKVTNEEHRSALEGALAKDRPLAAFMTVVKSDATVASEWNSFRISRVTEKVKGWMARHGLEFDLYDISALPVRPAKRSRESPKKGQTVVRPGSISRDGAGIEFVRERVQNAVSRMPLSELLQLRIPVEYMLEP